MPPGFFYITTSGRERETVMIRADLISSIESTGRNVSIRWPADTNTIIHMRTGENYATDVHIGEIQTLVGRALENRPSLPA